MKRTRVCDLLGIEYPIIQGGMGWGNRAFSAGNDSALQPFRFLRKQRLASLHRMTWCVLHAMDASWPIVSRISYSGTLSC